MLEGIVWERVGLGSGWALVVLAVVFIYRGWLVPKRFYDDIVHDRNEALTSNRLKDQHIFEQDRQLGHMAEVGKTMEAILLAIHSLAARSGGSHHEEEIL